MILATLIPYLVFACALLIVCAGGVTVVMPWIDGWGITDAVFLTVVGLMLLVVGGALALDVAHYLGWLP